MHADLTHWLQTGADHRSVLGPNGLTPYRTAMQPSAASPFGSCTASSPSPSAHRSATELLESWNRAEQQDAFVADQMSAIRMGLRAAFELPASSEIALCPSGTDALYLVNALIQNRGLHAHHIVVGASELGGGTVSAARGLVFSATQPFGIPQAKGTALDGLAEHCSADPMYLRETEGTPLLDDSVDDLVRIRVREAVSPERTVVVHLVAHSKTGLRAPSLELCRELRERYGDQVLIFVDAAQGRVAPRDLRNALAYGFMVLFTGSKFYSGVPFSGAILIPAAWADDPGALPESTHAWFDSASLPESWPLARNSLPSPINPGLMFRWHTALTEIDAYHATVPRKRAAVYATFAGAVHEVLGPDGAIDIEFPMPPVHGLVTGLGAFPTVFGFRVRDADGWLDAPAMKRLHALLDDGSESALHLGQPVSLGPPGPDRRVLLRVALGARLVTEFAARPDAGGLWMRERMGILRENVERLCSEVRSA